MVVRMSFTREELERFRDATVPDLRRGPATTAGACRHQLGRWTAASQTHFAHPSNRFYPALHRAGITDPELDRVAGLTDGNPSGLNAHETVASLATQPRSLRTTTRIRPYGFATAA
jgi:hypothetical protein